MSEQKPAQYSEGVLVGIPLDTGGWGVAIVARRQVRRRYGVRQVFLYVLNMVFEDIPSLAEVSGFNIAQVVGFAHTGDGNITSGRWPIIGPHPQFDHESWPVPPFYSGGGRFLCWLDNDDLQIVYLPIDTIHTADRKHFHLEWCTVNLPWCEGMIPQLMSRKDTLFSPEDLDAWGRYRSAILKSVPNAKSRPF